MFLLISLFHSTVLLQPVSLFLFFFIVPFTFSTICPTEYHSLIPPNYCSNFAPNIYAGLTYTYRCFLCSWKPSWIRCSSSNRRFLNEKRPYCFKSGMKVPVLVSCLFLWEQAQHHSLKGRYPGQRLTEGEGEREGGSGDK